MSDSDDSDGVSWSSAQHVFYQQQSLLQIKEEDDFNYGAPFDNSDNHILLNRSQRTDSAGNLSVEDYRLEAQNQVSGVLDAWNSLRTRLSLHWPAITKRWSKKSKEKQVLLLKEAWPGIPTPHRPDFHILRGAKGAARVERSSWIAAFRCPELNIEDLTKPRFLLHMMASRGRKFPAYFVDHDSDALKIGLRAGMIEEATARYSMIYLNGQMSSETYGRVVSWNDDDPESLRVIRDNKDEIAMDPGRGLLLLERQRSILNFLLRCCELVMHDISADTLKINAPTEFPELPIVEDEENFGYSSFAEETVRAPYHVPDHFDFEWLRTFVDAKWGQIEDRYIMLKEDPGFFAQSLEENSMISRMRIMNDLAGGWLNRKLPECRNGPSYTPFTAERSSSEQVYLRSRLFMLVTMLMDIILKRLIRCYANAPGLREYVTLKPEPCECHGLFNIRHNPQDYLWWLLIELSKPREPQQYATVCGLTNVLRELDVLLSQEKTQKRRMSSDLDNILSDAAILAEIERQIRLSTPNGRLNVPAHAEELDAEFRTGLTALSQMTKVLVLPEDRQGNLDLAGLTKDLRSVDYPSNKRPTAFTTEKMREAEMCLDLFWAAFDEMLVENLGKTLAELEGVAVRAQQIYRTPPWTEPPSKVCGTEEDFNHETSASLVFLTLEERTEQTVKADQQPKPRSKVKTRGIPTTETTEQMRQELDNQPPSTEQHELPKIPVSNKVLKAFSAIFHIPLTDAAPKELPWKGFVHAMSHVGFGGQKLGGSAWVFRQKDINLPEKILFHEPHPESKIPPQIARRIACRLQRTFGWTAETCVRAEDTASKASEGATIEQA